MFTLKTIEDARVWIKKLSHVASILMIGGDLTSFALTKALLHLQKKIFFLLDEDAFWPLRSNESLLDEVSQKLAERDVEVLRCKRLKSMARVSDHLYQVQVDDQKIEVGMIGAFFGLVPDIRFLARSGLTIDRGILVDEYLNAGFEGVYATGDCAQIYHPQIRDYWISIGHENAVALGRTAALNLVGGKVRADVDMESIYDVKGIKVNTSWWAEF
jgi:NADPH-dependent 2,4-dienoyl-CoA reductase/sulfur reductase-like enzyme